MNILITPAKIDDYLGFLDIFQEAEEFHRLQAPWKFKKPEPELFSRAYFEEKLSDPITKFLVAKNDDETIWFILAFKRETKNIPVMQDRTWIEIDNLAVKTVFRRQWIGDLLLSKIEDRAKSSHISDIEFNVWGFNVWARNFYEKCWYEVYSHRMKKTIK